MSTNSMTPRRSPLGCDPVRFEVIRNALAAAVDEMGVALQRSAYSSNIKTRGDFSCMFFDRHFIGPGPGPAAVPAGDGGPFSRSPDSVIDT